MITQEFTEVGIVERFPMQAAWYYLELPEFYSDLTKGMGRRGFVPIIARIGKTSWKTSILPMGKGKKFIAIKASVRKTEKIELGDTVSISFRFY
jgi:hypothetical protein